MDELKKIIETAARWNKKTLPPNYEKLLIVPPEEDSSGSFIDLFKMEYIRTTLLLMVAWYALVLQYMAITLHIGEMGGNIYLTTVRISLHNRNALTSFNSFHNRLLESLFEFYKTVRTAKA